MYPFVCFRFQAKIDMQTDSDQTLGRNVNQDLWHHCKTHHLKNLPPCLLNPPLCLKSPRRISLSILHQGCPDTLVVRLQISVVLCDSMHRKHCIRPATPVTRWSVAPKSGAKQYQVTLQSATSIEVRVRTCSLPTKNASPPLCKSRQRWNIVCRALIDDKIVLRPVQVSRFPPWTPMH